MGSWDMDKDDIMVVYAVCTYNRIMGCNVPYWVEIVRKSAGPIKGYRPSLEQDYKPLPYLLPLDTDALYKYIIYIIDMNIFAIC